MLLGRASECGRIETLVARCREGTSGVLVLRGEPGIGKTALLEHAAAVAGAATVLRARGVESEVQVAFGGLHELLRPVLGELGRLPGPQRVALEAALGLAPAAAAEPHLVGAAALGLLAALAEERPVVILADDVQWIDGPSASALTFAARRLLADAVAVLLAVRAGEPSPIDGAGLEELVLGGLAAEPARALLAAHAARPVAADTAGWLHSATRGNPLALVELAAEAPRLRPGPVGDHVPIGARIERAFGRRLDRLPAEALPSLLAAAVADGDELEPVLGAAPSLGGSLAGLEAAEAEGLVSLEAGRIAFSHPLVRSAVLARAAPADCRAAHRAYAGRLDPDADAERRAWHVAAGTFAGRRRGRRVARRRRRQRAAGAAGTPPRPPPSSRPRTSVPSRPDERSACAARLTRRGSRAMGRARSPCSTKPRRLRSRRAERAEAGHLRGRVLARRGPVPLAISVLRRRRKRSPGSSRPRPRRCWPRPPTRRSTGPVRWRTWTGSRGARPSSRRRTIRAPAAWLRSRWVRPSCWAARPGAADRLAEAAALIDSMPDLRDDVRLAALLGVPPTFMRVERAGYRPLVRAVALARERGAVGVLPFALFYLGMGALGSPRWAEAGAHFEEAAATRRRDRAARRRGHLAGRPRTPRARRGDAAATEHARTALRPGARVRHALLRGGRAARAGRRRRGRAAISRAP